MILKPCPFCGKYPTVRFENEFWILTCNNCKSNGLDISIRTKDNSNIQEIWNSRDFDEILLRNPNSTLDLLGFFNGSPITKSMEESFLDIDTIYLQNYFGDRNSGWLILPNGRILDCKDSHKNSLKKYLNMEEIDSFEFLEEYIQKKGIIRISSFRNSYGIDIPSTSNKEQRTRIYTFLEKLYNTSNRFVVEYTNKDNKTEVRCFDNLNNLKKFIEGIE